MKAFDNFGLEKFGITSAFFSYEARIFEASRDKPGKLHVSLFVEFHFLL